MKLSLRDSRCSLTNKVCVQGHVGVQLGRCLTHKLLASCRRRVSCFCLHAVEVAECTRDGFVAITNSTWMWFCQNE